ncbi:beta-eliminating lyase-related protein [Kitasatospora sp. MAP5-34]|uniref:threonine aldolase family protein n=1 Tax=Kitasatospora sp. MAP5-34 TaxID=3035102 RepID=UPI002475684B|nr:beta-eliminating lyase-related protein [Kitasatospora sp. MAP5-34]MDH6576725.1 threonine aldolase [Kitasatospora sp. MAP5-34]
MADTFSDSPSDAIPTASHAARTDEAPFTDPRQRRFAALRGCDRLLSGVRPQNLRERLASLTTDAESAYDLDERPDMYGDGVVRALEKRVAELLGKPDAAFFPTGTMAQQVALRYWSSEHRTVAMHPLAHPERHEQRAYSRLTGLQSVWPTTAPRLPTAEEVRGVVDDYDVLMLELPLRDAGFVLPTWDELTGTVAAANDAGAVVHLDGARLWESVHHLGHSLPEIAGLADSVYVSFYKTLGGISGAAVAGDEHFVREAKLWRHRYGGQLWQQWPAALTALAGLNRELPRLEEYVRHAKVVAETLAAVPGARINPEPPHTHQFQLWLPYPADALNEAGLRLAEEQQTALFGWWDEPGLPGLSYTEVTVAAAALEWTPKEIADAMTSFLALLQERADVLG